MKKFFLGIGEWFADIWDRCELAVVDGKLAELGLEPMSPYSRQVLRELYEDSRNDLLARIEARENPQQGATAQ
jgi:hypothetical protein